jgi:hypothetical protein
MTTQIDRILSQIIPAFVDYNLRTKKHIIEYWDTPETIQLAEDRLNIEKQLEYNLRQILEAELTAVNGVDELIEKKLEERYNRKPTDYLNVPWLLINIAKNDLKALKQTPVASECKHECDKYVDADGVHCERCTELIEPTTEERLNDSQPKVVEIKYVIRKCVCKTTLWLSDNYCPKCGSKIKWIA